MSGHVVTVKPSSYSVLPLARVRRGLGALREWLRLYGAVFEIKPGKVAERLGLGHSGAIDVGYALRWWERLGYAVRLPGKRARYLVTDKLLLILEAHGCLERHSCDHESACGLIGTVSCPFLEGYEGDDNGT